MTPYERFRAAQREWVITAADDLFTAFLDIQQYRVKAARAERRRLYAQALKGAA